MKTNFSEFQLVDPHVVEADKILKTCQHFGFCTSGCPTYVILHNEKDGPRGRIDLIKEMLESGTAPSAETVAHIDGCLSCMSCMTTCAVNVDYMHLVDIGRAHIEEHYKRPVRERLVRNTLSYIMSRPALFRPALALGRLAARVEYIIPRSMRHVTQLVPKRTEGNIELIPHANIYPAQGSKRWRVALLAGCVQPVLSPHINDATIRMLTRFGCEVIVPQASGCCGSLNLHMGKHAAAQQFAKLNVQAWIKELNDSGLDAILTNASGCGTTVKDYGHLLRDDAAMAEPADRVGGLAMGICEWLAKMELPEPEMPRRYRVAYHDACSLRNAQKVVSQPRTLLRGAGFQVADIPEAHFCCGSAGTYNILQPSMAQELGKRKASNISRTSPQIIAAGNIGCITQIGIYSEIPIAHTVELLDWAHGGPLPLALKNLSLEEIAPELRPDAESERPAEKIIHLLNKKDADQSNVGVW